jgi:hypothetical protein
MENKNEPPFANGKICYIEIPSIKIKESSSFIIKSSDGKSEHGVTALLLSMMA